MVMLIPQMAIADAHLAPNHTKVQNRQQKNLQRDCYFRVSGERFLVDEAAHADIHDDAQGHEGEENGGASVAEQR